MISVILPCYNEKDNIVHLATEIHKALSPSNYEHEIVIVDDNSPDKTYSVLQKANLSYVNAILREETPSLGGSILTGIKAAKGDVIVVMDSDFNHRPKDIPILVDNIKYFDCVSASRFVYGGDMGSWFRHHASWIFNIITRILTRTFVTDSLFGFYAIRRSALENLNLDAIFWGYGDYCIRFMYFLQKNNCTILQIPGVLGKRMSGEGNKKFVRTLFKYTHAVLKLALGAKNIRRSELSPMYDKSNLEKEA